MTACNIAADLGREVIIFGGLPMRRVDVYAAMVEAGHDKRAAGLFAFGPNTRVVVTDPVSLAEFRKIVIEAGANQ